MGNRLVTVVLIAGTNNLAVTFTVCIVAAVVHRRVRFSQPAAASDHTVFLAAVHGEHGLAAKGLHLRQL